MKRREFLKKSALTTGSLLASHSLLMSSNILGANDTVNIGVIGTGSRGGGLTSVINRIDNIRVVACADILPFRLQQGADRAKGSVKAYKDYRKLLDNKDVDAVIVSTPFSTHGKIAMDALDAGKHVYCEKTLTKGYDEIDQLVKMAKRSPLIVQTGHQYHSSRLYTHVVEEIKNGKIGKIAAFECQWNRNGNWRRPVPEPKEKYERMVNWRMYREYSGGLVAELCSHQIDFANWVLGETPAQVMGVGGIDYWKDGRETFDNIHLIYTYPNGVDAEFTCLTSNAKDDYQIKVMGDQGTITLDYGNAWFYPEGNYETKEHAVVDGVSGATVPWEQQKGIPFEINHMDASRQALVDFAHSIRNNSAPISNVKTGADTAVAVEMALQSMYNQQIVHWPAQF